MTTYPRGTLRGFLCGTCLVAAVTGGCGDDDPTMPMDGTGTTAGWLDSSGSTTMGTTGGLGDASASTGAALEGGAAGTTGTTSGTAASGATGGPPADAGVGSGDTGAPDPGPIDHNRNACELVTGSEGAAGPLNLQVDVVAEGLEVPWGIDFLPNGDMLVTERPGRLRRISQGSLVNAPVLEVDVAEILFSAFGYEGGLLGVLVHPQFDSNRQIYLYFTDRDTGGNLINRLGLYTLSDDLTTATLQRMLLDDIPAGEHHQGGRMRIGPDGKLYVGVGAFDPSLAQRADQLAGKLLRLNLDGSVPADNPTKDSYVFLTGVRNTQGFDFYDAHHLLVMDHGPTAIDPGVPETGWDEFNVARAGENLGWPEVLGCETGSGVTAPVMVWQASMPPGGAAIYTGSAIPSWRGSLLVGTLGFPGSGSGQHLHRIALSADNPYVVERHEVYLKNAYGRLRTVQMGPDGHVYVTTSNCDGRGDCPAQKDRILRIRGAQ